jgi:hypothetical protein
VTAKHYSGKSVPQGLKPNSFVAFVGTTEVVPFQNCGSHRVFTQPAKPIGIGGILLHD